MVVYDSVGRPVRLGAVLARGGEAIVYRVPSHPTLVAKLYTPRPRARTAEKVRWMKERPPTFPTIEAGHKLVAWPQETLHNQRKQFIGYLMPYIPDSVPLLAAYSPRLREKALPTFDERFRYRAAQHLAHAVGLLHDKGYIIGDLNESNVLVTRDALITLIDADSFQVVGESKGKKVLHPCPVGKAEYAAPELQGKHLGGIQRLPIHDYFALAVLIFKLLMDGRHPFQSQWCAKGESPVLEEKIAQGWFPHIREQKGPVAPPPNTPPLDTLNPQVTALFRRCFVDGHTDPAARPNAQEWMTALRAAEAGLRRCPNNHLFSRHAGRCPRCGQAPTMLPGWAHRIFHAVGQAGHNLVIGSMQLVTQQIAYLTNVPKTWWGMLRRAGRRSAHVRLHPSGVRQLALPFLGTLFVTSGASVAAAAGLPTGVTLFERPVATLLTFATLALIPHILQPGIVTSRHLQWRGWKSLCTLSFLRTCMAGMALLVVLLPLQMLTLAVVPMADTVSRALFTSGLLLASTVVVAVYWHAYRVVTFLLASIALTALWSHVLDLLPFLVFINLLTILFISSVHLRIQEYHIALRTPTRRTASTVALVALSSLTLLGIARAQERPELPRVRTLVRYTATWIEAVGAPLASSRAWVVNVAPGGLPVRRSPSKEAEVITTLAEGSRVELGEVRFVDGIYWRRIQARGVAGWASGAYLELE